MKIFNAKKISDIRNIIQENRLTSITIKTGDENIYIPKENKYIVTKDFLRDKFDVFRGCDSLEKIIMEDFDFSEITTMEFWFSNCKNLTEIIFPKKANCQNLTALYGCFSHTNMDTIDLSFMNFNNNHNFINLNGAFWATSARKITLPKCNQINRIDACFADSKNLEEIIAPIKIYLYNEDSFLETFENCYKLKLIDFSNGKVSKQGLFEHLNNPINKNNILEDCVIILP